MQGRRDVRTYGRMEKRGERERGGVGGKVGGREGRKGESKMGERVVIGQVERSRIDQVRTAALAFLQATEGCVSSKFYFCADNGHRQWRAFGLPLGSRLTLSRFLLYTDETSAQRFESSRHILEIFFHGCSVQSG